MSAECEKHGVDLHGNTTTGLICPLCERDHHIDDLIHKVDRMRRDGPEQVAKLVSQATEIRDLRDELEYRASRAKLLEDAGRGLAYFAERTLKWFQEQPDIDSPETERLARLWLDGWRRALEAKGHMNLAKRSEVREQARTL